MTIIGGRDAIYPHREWLVRRDATPARDVASETLQIVVSTPLCETVRHP